MTIKTSCPDCEASYTLADSQRGKKVRCRKCTNTFVVGGDAADDAPALTPRNGAKPRKDGLSTAPRPASKTPPPKSKPAAVRRDRDHDEDDDEDDGPPRKPDVKKKGSATPMILMIVGGVLLLFLMCGGAAIFGVYWWTSATVTNIGNNITDNINNIQNNLPNDPGPGQVNLPPGFPFGDNPKDVGEALSWLNGAADANKRNAAADWLSRAVVDDAHQKEVAKALEDAAKNPNTHDAAIRGLATWAGPADYPTLLAEADRSAPAADTLARAGYEPAAAAFAQKLPDFFGHGDAARRLAQMGKVAEKEVLKQLNNPNGDAHNEAAKLLAGFGTTNDAKLDQCISDLKNPDGGYERNACDSLSKTPVNEARRVEVSTALETPLADSNADTRKAAATALKTWATKNNVPALIAEIDRNDAFNGSFEPAAQALAVLKDERGAEAVARHLTNPFQRDAAAKALRDMGSVAEKAVAAYQNSNDSWVRDQANSLLKAYGTKSDVKLDGVIAGLDAADADQRKSACDALAAMPVDPAKRKQVARGLEKLLDDRDPFHGVPDAAARALAVWGDKDSVPPLILAFQRKDSKCWQSAVDALVMLKDERAVEPLLIAATSDFFHKDAAKKALTDLGPLVEVALDNIVSDQTSPIARRVAACQYIADPGIGTSKSLPVLQAASMDPNAALKNMAVSVLKVVKTRP